MRHLKKGKKFGRKRSERRAFLKSLGANLVLKESVVTTETRAKEIRRVVERLVTHGKKQNLAALRLLLQKLPKAAAHKLYRDIAPRYKNRKGGYTRIVKYPLRRAGDGAKRARIEFV